MKQLNLAPVEPVQPTNVQWQWIDQTSGNLSAQGCPGATYIPMLTSTVPGQATPCGMQHMYGSQEAPYGETELDENGQPVYQPYARRVPEPADTGEASINLELPPDPDTGKPPVVRRFWSSE